MNDPETIQEKLDNASADLERARSEALYALRQLHKARQPIFASMWADCLQRAVDAVERIAAIEIPG